jgi:hypothetical protein
MLQDASADFDGDGVRDLAHDREVRDRHFVPAPWILSRAACFLDQPLQFVFRLTSHLRQVFGSCVSGLV